MTSSSNGTIAVSGQSITDAAGNVWSIGGGQVEVNGIPDTTTANVSELAYEGGLVWQQNTSNLWWSKSAPTDQWAPLSETSVSPVPPSPDNTFITVPDTVLSDAGGNQWYINNNGRIVVNGTVDQASANVIALAHENGLVWQENTSDLWWSKTNPSAAWVSGNDPLGKPLLESWIGGQSENSVADPRNWSGNSFAAGDMLVMQQGTMLDVAPNAVFNGITPDPLLIMGGGSSIPIIDLYDQGNITLEAVGSAPSVVVNTGGEATVPAEGDDPTIAINGAVPFNVSVNELETAGVVIQDTSMSFGTLAVNSTPGSGIAQTIFKGVNSFAGTHVLLNTNLGLYTSPVTSVPGYVYLSAGASLELNGTPGGGFFFVGATNDGGGVVSAAPSTAASLVVDNPSVGTPAVQLFNGSVELKGLAATSYATSGADIVQFFAGNTVIGSLALLDQQAIGVQFSTNSAGTFITTGDNLPTGNQLIPIHT